MSVKKPAPTRPTVIRTRPCLMCTQPFTSHGAGERICGECKRKSAWRQHASGAS